MSAAPGKHDRSESTPAPESPAASDGHGNAVADASQQLMRVEDLRIELNATGQDVVDEVSFTLQRGQVLGVVGESGSGKTTVGLALLGHARRGLRIQAGRILFEGRDLLTLGSKLRELRGRRIAYVAQDPASALNPALKVGTQLREVFKIHESDGTERVDAEARIRELLVDVRLDGVGHVLDVYPHQLSGGQQQRVMLAIAFAHRPSLIVLDEPTTGLDVTTQRHVLDTVRGLCERYNVAAVYVGHDLAVVAELVDYVGVMYAGRVIELGPVTNVFQRPAHPYTRGLLRAIPSPTRAHVLAGLEGQPPPPGSRPGGCFFAPRCDFAQDQCLAAFPPPSSPDGTDRWVRCFRAAEVVALEPFAELPERRRSCENPADAPLLELNAVDAHHGTRQVLSDIRLAVHPGQCLAVVGESGAGKTTVARCIVGLHTAWSGQIVFDGAPLANDRRRREREQIRRMQYIFQSPYTALNPRKTVGELVEQPLRELFSLSRKERRVRVDAALADAALTTAYARRFPDQLSGGERQRVAIARALVVEPEMLVCDEVTSALDVSVQAAIVELLHRLQHERGVTLLLITHNLALVRSLADDVLILRDGKIVEQGTRVLDEPATPYARQLLDNVPTLPLS